ncbi:MAG: hypothetical protein ABIE70_01790 [bacterium]
MAGADSTYRLSNPGRLGTVALVVGILGLAGSIGAYFQDQSQFYFSWLIAFVFWTTIALGGLFFTMLHHLVAATWSVVLRRLAENLAGPLVLMAVFFTPVLFGMHDLFHWTHADAMAHDELLQGKSGYLNPTFFVIRGFGYFVVWIVLWLLLRRVSLGQDVAPSSRQTKRMITISAPGMILFGITITFAGFDWLMSLDPHWYSTIFGVYIFAGALVGVISFLILLSLALRRKGVLEGIVTSEHDHDLGKLLFAFTIFWGYMAFSQYFLIWYGNIPEETVWMLHRWEGSWKTVTLALVFGHFVLPFFALFPHATKRFRPAMLTIALWMLAMHWLDLYWIAMPILHHHGAHISWVDLTTMFGIGGIFIWWTWRMIAAQPVVPVGDPKLEASIHHHQ